MALTECAKGHLYNTDQYAACPYCNHMGKRIDFEGKKTSAPEYYRSEVEHPKVNKTVAPEYYRSEVEHPKVNKTVGILEKNMHIDPIVGWIVCIEGAGRGKDFQIRAANNTIGRSEDMDICIKEDPTISRENYARLSYDLKHNDFYIIPAEKANNIYLNDQPVYVPTKLSAYDLLELGESKFLFVPFCNNKFKWEDKNR